MDTSQAELEEEEALSGAGEGDEIMEEVAEREGYSAYYVLLVNDNMVVMLVYIPRLSFHRILMIFFPQLEVI